MKIIILLMCLLPFKSIAGVSTMTTSVKVEKMYRTMTIEKALKLCAEDKERKICNKKIDGSIEILDGDNLVIFESVSK